MSGGGDDGADDLLDATFSVHPAFVVRVYGGILDVPWLEGPPDDYFDEAAHDIRQLPHSTPLDFPGLVLVEAIASERFRTPREALQHVASALQLDEEARVELDQLARTLFLRRLLHAGTTHFGAADASPRIQRVEEVQLPSPEEADRLATSPTLRSLSPIAFTLGSRGFEHRSHDDRIIAQLSARTVMAVVSLSKPASADEAFGLLVTATGGAYGDRTEFEEDIRLLARSGLLSATDETARARTQRAMREGARILRIFDAEMRDAVEQERERYRSTGIRRAMVVPVAATHIPVLSLGMLIAFAKSFGDGKLNEHYRFTEHLRTKPERFATVLKALGDWPCIFLFSNYTWSTSQNLRMSAIAKAAKPDCITIHGGPDTPKYEADNERYFHQNPSIDITVRGEGEVTFVHLLDTLAGAWHDSGTIPEMALQRLRDVDGLSFRSRGEIVRSGDRERIADLDILPSPYLTDYFGEAATRGYRSVTLETNRGCPYGCTFCDWGSATLSRIRKFDLQRVRDEMEWAARNAMSLNIADANFGMLDRDVELVEWAVELKERYGHPTGFQVNYAKNKVGNLTKIVRILSDAEILTEGLVSVQSMNATVLKTIRRSNIKMERYDALAEEFRDNHLPLFTDVILGLPGSTVETVTGDLQQTIDREVQVRFHPAQLLVNSPMNEPEYREEHGIVDLPSHPVQQARTFSRDDWHEMMRMRRFHYLAETRGVFRQIGTYVRSEIGVPETDLYQMLHAAGHDERRYPQLAYCFSAATMKFLAPGSWRPLIEEVGEYVVSELGLADDSALRTVLAVQHALVPARQRKMPLEIELEHDYVGWHGEVVRAKLAHPDGTWPTHISPLRQLGPAIFQVQDDLGAESVIGRSVIVTFGDDHAWEYSSDVRRGGRDGGHRGDRPEPGSERQVAIGSNVRIRTTGSGDRAPNRLGASHNESEWAL